MAVFETKNLTFFYPDSDTAALSGLDFKAEAGECVLVMGRSGSGKSTLLKLLKKEIAPVGRLEGEIAVNSQSIGYVGQAPDASFVAENVRGELAFALENLSLSPDEMTVRIGETASFFNLDNMLDKRLCELSGGEKETVAIAACVVAGGDALLLDEPFSQLDPKAVQSTSALIRRINEELGVTVVIVSHTSQELIDFCDRVVILDNGKKLCDSSPEAAVKNDEAVGFFPAFTRFFKERPLTVKQAVPLAEGLSEKPVEATEKSDFCVRLKGISFRYSKSSPDVLKRLDFSAYAGKINCIIGANASGKTTLLKIIAGVNRPYEGKIKIKGKVAYMPQNVKYLFVKDTVGEEISTETAQRLKISDCLQKHPYDLSGGQAQRLAFGILLEQNADILLLDEPTKAFDEFSKAELWQLLNSLCAQGKTIILVSHDLDFVGEAADYVSFLTDSIISKAGGRREVLSSLNYYTTQLRRITKKYLKSAVSVEDIQ